MSSTRPSTRNSTNARRVYFVTNREDNEGSPAGARTHPLPVISNAGRIPELHSQANAKSRADAILHAVQKTVAAILFSGDLSAEERTRRLARVFRSAKSSCSKDIPLMSVLNEPLDDVDLPPLFYEILRIPSDVSSSASKANETASIAVVRFIIENWDGSLINLPSVGSGDLPRMVRKACLRRRDDDSGNSVFQLIRPLVASKLSAPALDLKIAGMLAPKPSTDFSLEVRPLYMANTVASGLSVFAFEVVIDIHNISKQARSSPTISRRSSVQSLRVESRQPLPIPPVTPSPTSGRFKEANHVAIFSAEFLASNCAWAFDLGRNSIKLTLLESEGYVNIDSFFVEASVELLSSSQSLHTIGITQERKYYFALPLARLYFPSQPRRGGNSTTLSPCFQAENTFGCTESFDSLSRGIYGFDDERLVGHEDGGLHFKMTVRLHRPAEQPIQVGRVQGPRPVRVPPSSADGASKQRRNSEFVRSDGSGPLQPIKEDNSEIQDAGSPWRPAGNTYHGFTRVKPPLFSVSSSSSSSDATSLFSAPKTPLSSATSIDPLSSTSCLINNNNLGAKLEDASEIRDAGRCLTPDTSESQKQANTKPGKATNCDINALASAVLNDGRRDAIFKEIEGIYGINLPKVRKLVWKEEQLAVKTWVYPFSICFCLQYLHWALSNDIVFVDVSFSSLLAEVREWQGWSPFRAIAHAASTRDTLVDISKLTDVRYTSHQEPGRQTPDFAWKEAIIYALKRDNDDLTRLLSSVVSGGEIVVKEVSESQDKDYFAFTEVLQQQIDKQPGLHRVMERFLQKAVRSSGRLPRCLFVSEVKRLGENPIAGGGFADVWKGEARGDPVALKVLRIFGLAKATSSLQEFCLEAMIWRQLRHRNILLFRGVCVDVFSPQLALVSPWMVNGDVVTYVKKYPTVNRSSLITGIAAGIAYLHSSKPVVVHGDLRAANILVDNRGCPKVADFGLAKVIDSQASAIGGTSFCGKGAMRWQAPELLNSDRFEGISSSTSIGSDVYAFACVCLEVFTEEIPFHYLRDGEVVLEVAIKDTRPRRPPEPAMTRGLSDSVWNLMERCWATHPSARPDIETVHQELENIDLFYAPFEDN